MGVALRRIVVGWLLGEEAGSEHCSPWDGEREREEGRERGKEKGVREKNERSGLK